MAEGTVKAVMTVSCVHLQFGFCNEYEGLMSDFFGSEALCLTTLLRQGHLDAHIACTTAGTHFYITLATRVITKDFSEVSLDVARFVTIWTAGGPDYQVEDLADVLEDLLDITISNTHGERIDEIQQALFNLYALIGAQGRRNADIPANKVIVTRRRVVETESEWNINSLNWHAALEWTVFDQDDPGWIAGNPTIAAYQRSLRLKSERNHPSERNNLFSGTVSAISLPVTVSIWLALSEADRKYCDSLYYRFPLDSATDKYNSNGFAAGIINAINGVTDAPIGSYLYGGNLVPKIEFEQETCN